MLSVPVLLFILVFLGDTFITWQIAPPIEIAETQIIVAAAVLYLATAWAAWCACWLIAEVIIASPAFPDDTYDVHLVRIVARVSAPLAAGGIALYGANDIGVPALGLLAGVSIGGIALALAAQYTIENLFGGLSIFADRPFRVGDTIRFGGNGGTVEMIGPRSTRIRGKDGTLMTVPNGDLARAQLVNVSARPSSLFNQRISLPLTCPASSSRHCLRSYCVASAPIHWLRRRRARRAFAWSASGAGIAGHRHSAQHRKRNQVGVNIARQAPRQAVFPVRRNHRPRGPSRG
jgi:MscS family membrane protein